MIDTAFVKKICQLIFSCNANILTFNLGVKMCFIFSLSGVIFLTILAILLGHNSQYLKVSMENSGKKPKLVQGVLGAIFMYVACLVLSGYLWYKSSTAENLETSRLAD